MMDNNNNHHNSTKAKKNSFFLSLPITTCFFIHSSRNFLMHKPKENAFFFFGKRASFNLIGLINKDLA
jgi:hypothetical protein